MKREELEKITQPLIDDYNTGMTLREVAKKHNTSHSTVMYRLTKLGIPRRKQNHRGLGRHKPETNIKIRKSKAMRERGYSLREISEELNCSRERARQLLLMEAD